MLRKRLVDVTADDLNDLVARKAQEDTVLDFKKTLSTRDGTPDAWESGQDKIGSVAKRDLTKELIAFANTRGGTLILGVEEDGEKRAARLNPIRDCRVLVDRLAASIVASVDPPLTSLEAVGIELDGTTGVIVFRVPPSHRAPHRDKDDRECYHRSGDSSLSMSMRQIQDLAVGKAREAESVSQTLDKRSITFVVRQPQAEFVLLDGVGNVPAVLCGMRGSAYPLESVFIEEMNKRREFNLIVPTLVRLTDDGGQKVFAPSEGLNWSPILRGLRCREGYSDHHEVTHTIRSDGLVEITTRIRQEPRYGRGWDGLGVHVKFMLWTFAHLIVRTEVLRTLIGRPELEFALDFEWIFPNGARIVYSSDDGFGSFRSAVAVDERSRVSDYEMPTRDRIPQFWMQLQDDIRSSFGLDGVVVHRFDFNEAISQVLARVGQLS
ncbi:AlbA family DNA-binding domain-containing protein [Methylobacterium sp. ID0610]|uniref:AlbA family DNA-binding domain-containing protein n=1 Tax=Methylobacterium carpenticola TaxID=3344827 RepID=UPI00369F9731